LGKTLSIYSLGDSAITLDLGHLIDEQLNIKVLAIESRLRAHPFPGMQDVIVAYGSVTVFYDPVEVGVKSPGGGENIYNYVCSLLEEAYAAVEASALPASTDAGAVVRIPVCYGGMFGSDLEEVGRVGQISPDEVIQLHVGMIYRVYMIGFLPGFPYLGKVDPRLEVGRKARPVPVVAGGVGIAGNQTGIYPVNSPGGWQIIGRTPVRLFDPAATPPVKLAIGDRVTFYPISAEEFWSFCPG
jgi:inhibitor of KinA